MTYSATWLYEVLVAAGLKVQEGENWRTRGHGDMGRIIGVICHHTAGGKSPYPMPSLMTVTRGRPGLAGPLCNLGLGRDGTWYCVAAGCGWHAGVGKWKGVTSGNRMFVGVEAENSGYISGKTAELWPAAQIDAYQMGCAAILDHIRQPVTQCIGHKEWALPKGRKTDPTFNMTQFRDGVAFYMKNPHGHWTGTLDRMVARLSKPTKQNIDGCSHAMGATDCLVPQVTSPPHNL